MDVSTNSKVTVTREAGGGSWAVHIEGYQEQGSIVFTDEQIKSELLACGVFIAKRSGIPIRVWKDADDESMWFAYGYKVKSIGIIRFYDYDAVKFPLSCITGMIHDLIDIQEYCRTEWGCIFPE